MDNASGQIPALQVSITGYQKNIMKNFTIPVARAKGVW